MRHNIGCENDDKLKRIPMAKARIITDSNFDEVLKSEKLILIDFWAEWCMPCRILGPLVEELAVDYEGRAVIAKVNVDENPKVSDQFGIDAIPSIILFRDGRVVDLQVGVVP